MLRGFRVPALEAFAFAALTVAVAGCAPLRPPPPAEVPPAQEGADSGSARTYLTLADRREDAGDWPGALAVVDKALVQNPGSQTLQMRRAQLLMRRASDEGTPELHEEARAILAVSTEASGAESRVTLAWLDFEDGRRDEALAAAHAAADADPESARVQIILSELLYRNGDYHGAVRAAERAGELAPRSGAALRQRARTRLALADVTGATGDARAALRMHHDDAASSVILADAQLRQADATGAMRTLAAVPRARRSVRVLVPLARLEVGAGNAEAGRALLQEAVAAQPNDPQVHEALVALDIREERVGESIARLDAAVAARPDDAALHRLRGIALVADRRDDDATASFARSLAIDPNELATYVALLDFLRTRTKSDEALHRAAELGIGAGPTFVTIGLLREGRGDRAGARTHFQQALEADPKLAVARSALAMSYVATGENLDQALTLARAARAARPNDPAIADTLGMVHLRRGQSSAALDVLAEAAGTHSVWSPGFAEVLYHTAMALEATGDRATAQRAAGVALVVAGDRKPEPAWFTNARAIVARSKPAPKPAPAPAPTPTVAPNPTAATPPASEATSTTPPPESPKP
jgi:tetratricopeptide (TPR) repeat protein